MKKFIFIFGFLALGFSVSTYAFDCSSLEASYYQGPQGNGGCGCSPGMTTTVETAGPDNQCACTVNRDDRSCSCIDGGSSASCSCNTSTVCPLGKTFDAATCECKAASASTPTPTPAPVPCGTPVPAGYCSNFENSNFSMMAPGSDVMGPGTATSCSGANGCGNYTDSLMHFYGSQPLLGSGCECEITTCTFQKGTVGSVGIGNPVGSGNQSGGPGYSTDIVFGTPSTCKGPLVCRPKASCEITSTPVSCCVEDATHYGDPACTGAGGLPGTNEVSDSKKCKLKTGCCVVPDSDSFGDPACPAGGPSSTQFSDSKFCKKKTHCCSTGPGAPTCSSPLAADEVSDAGACTVTPKKACCQEDATHYSTVATDKCTGAGGAPSATEVAVPAKCSLKTGCCSDPTLNANPPCSGAGQTPNSTQFSDPGLCTAKIPCCVAGSGMQNTNACTGPGKTPRISSTVGEVKDQSLCSCQVGYEFNADKSACTKTVVVSEEDKCKAQPNQYFSKTSNQCKCIPPYENLGTADSPNCQFIAAKHYCDNGAGGPSPVSPQVKGATSAARFEDVVNKKLACCMNSSNPGDTFTKFDCVDNSKSANDFNSLWNSVDDSSDTNQLNAILLTNGGGKPLTGFYTTDGVRCNEMSEFAVPGATFETREVDPVMTPKQQSTNSNLEGKVTGSIQAPHGNPLFSKIGSSKKFPSNLADYRRCPILVRAAMVATCPQNPSMPVVQTTYTDPVTKQIRCSAASSIQIHVRAEQVYVISGQTPMKTLDTVMDAGQAGTISIGTLLQQKNGGQCEPGAINKAGNTCMYQ